MPKTILKILELWMQNEATKLISYITRVSKKAIWRLLKKVRRIIVPRYNYLVKQVGGSDIIVEVDESKFGKRKYNKVHHVEGIWILGMVELTP
ncbi:hypothetical protein ENBRE01_2150 [Enteropsectra breve]|nr:hypothetical protein ENBRE01_2150 [Enteropsectra breve]